MKTANDLKPGEIAYFSSSYGGRWFVSHYINTTGDGSYRSNNEYSQEHSTMAYCFCLTPEQYHAMLNKPKDKQPVYCWNNSATHARELRFYDAKNSCTFSYAGKRDGADYSNIEPIQKHLIPEWMIEAQKMLAD